MARADPWQTAEVAGPKKAAVLNQAEVAMAVIRRAKRPLLLVGHRAAEITLGGRPLIDWVIRLSKGAALPIIASGKAAAALVGRRYPPAACLPVMDAANRLADPAWTGIDGKGGSDLVLLIGLPYPMAWTVLSGLKHFAPHLKTITIDNVYHPQASLSFPNLSEEEWAEHLGALIEHFEE
ncbi:MAG: CO dehydrogenase/acetyl-CoA synthase complex subunit epsilon [Methanomicrobiales archaeon]|nr:CO dehydrogenase/acetyl-CoA synthase complex subunit epsilon [Methanomicrobiales archaeon]